jgi:hypothetical protein
MPTQVEILIKKDNIVVHKVAELSDDHSRVSIKTSQGVLSWGVSSEPDWNESTKRPLYLANFELPYTTQWFSVADRKKMTDEWIKQLQDQNVKVKTLPPVGYMDERRDRRVMDMAGDRGVIKTMFAITSAVPKMLLLGCMAIGAVLMYFARIFLLKYGIAI